MIRWEILSFTELSPCQLYDILQLRAAIFVVEQKCTYQDVDGYDLNAFHVLGWDSEVLGAYARILPPHSKYPQCSIGRVAVAETHRGKGLARECMQRALDAALRQYPGQPILAQSQCYLEKFYQSFGFTAVSEPYDDDGIPHIDMIRQN